MKRIACILLVIGLIGIAVPAVADPERSQRLRGLGDRMFAVDVEIIDSIDENLIGITFANCYTFQADGTWHDPLFPDPGPPVPGIWVQHTVGASTKYTAYAVAAPLALLQQGVVTPRRGKGVLQLEAYSTVLLFDEFFAEVLSVGREVDACPTAP